MHHPMFLFLPENKTNVANVQSNIRSLSPNFVVGVDDVSSRGGLVVLGWTSNVVVDKCSCQNFIVLCNIVESSGESCYVCFLYGAQV